MLQGLMNFSSLTPSQVRARPPAYEILHLELTAWLDPLTYVVAFDNAWYYLLLRRWSDGDYLLIDGEPTMAGLD
jgi:hypothetical protein